MAADRRQRTRRLRSTSDWPHKFETPPQEREREQKYLDVISCGECETCEFKPYIDLSNKKAADLEKTACAFSNHRGGVIFIGVTDEGDVVGVTARDIAGRSDDPANALAEYEKAVRVRLRATLKDNQCFRSNVSAFAGKRAVVVEVELSREINYLVGSDLAHWPTSVEAKCHRPRS